MESPALNSGALVRHLENLASQLLTPVGDSPIHGTVVWIARGAVDPVAVAVALGAARSDRAQTMTIGQPFHIASVAKTLTATRIVQLAETGTLGADGIDARYADFSVLPAPLLRQLNQHGGIERGEAITIRQLLTHTAGLRDAVIDDASQCGGPAPGSIIGRQLTSPQAAGHHWCAWNPGTPQDAMSGVINFFFASGIAAASLSPPGAAFHYSDTGYVLLAMLIETVSGEPLHRSLRTHVLEPAGMRNTYLAYHEDPPLEAGRAPEAEVYFGPIPVLASGASLSFDWGGGGLVSTVEDLARFFTALRQGRLFAYPHSWSAMTNWINPPGLAHPRTGVGLGLFRMQWDELECWGHAGAWGTRVEYFPQHELLFVGTTNQVHTPTAWHLPLVRAAIEKAI